jgi:anaerobic selenocysteine-containing dehydrogenase
MNETEVVKSVCMLCFMVCGVDAHVKDGVLLRVQGMNEHVATQGALCPRGYHLPDYVYSPHRLKYPLIRDKEGSFKRATWDEAVEFVVGDSSEGAVCRRDFPGECRVATK